MKVISVARFGDADSLVLETRPDPVAGPGEVVIGVEAAGVGYVDIMARKGGYVAFPEAGFVPGLEVAGQVLATGAGVDPAWIGKSAFAMPMKGGGYAERVRVAAAQLVPIPEGLSCRSAVALGMNAIVAKIAVTRAAVARGESLFVRGAGGGIGMMAVQFGAALGAIVSATTSSETRSKRLRALGAARIIDRTAATRDGDENYDVIVDTVAGPELSQQIGRLNDNGRYILCGGVAGAPKADFGMALLGIFHRSPTFLAFSLNSLPATTVVAAATEVFADAVAGRVSAVIDRELRLDEAVAAHVALEAGAPFGKVLLIP